MRKTIGKIVLSIAAFFAISGSEKSVATVIPLGSVMSPMTFSLGNCGLLAPFSDAYFFTITAGKTFDFSSLVSAGFVRGYGISDFAGSLFGSGGLLVNGMSATCYPPEGFPAFDVTVSLLLPGAR